MVVCWSLWVLALNSLLVNDRRICLKLVMVGLSTPWKLARTTNHGFSPGL